MVRPHLMAILTPPIRSAHKPPKLLSIPASSPSQLCKAQRMKALTFFAHFRHHNRQTFLKALWRYMASERDLSLVKSTSALPSSLVITYFILSSFKAYKKATLKTKEKWETGCSNITLQKEKKEGQDQATKEIKSPNKCCVCLTIQTCQNHVM